jgi:hypothetical protein
MDSKKIKKVAVIAVHGVGDQQPFDTAHRIGDLLQDLNVGQTPNQKAPAAAEQHPVYYPFHEETIRVDVRPIVVKNRLELAHSEEARGPFNTWVKQCLKEGKHPTDDSVWYEFARGQLSAYRGDDPEDTYQTVRMEGRRAPQVAYPAVDVHVYELYWADLSRLKAGMLSIFTELYQILFHLPSLGTLTVNAAALHHRTADWRILRQLQSWSAGILTVPIPILNLLMLAFVTEVVVMSKLIKLGIVAQEILLGFAVMALSVALAGWVLWRLLGRRKIAVWIWLSPLVVGGLVGLTVALGKTSKRLLGRSDYVQLVPWFDGALIAALALFVVGSIMWVYEKRRPGALKCTGLITLLALVAGIVSIHYPKHDSSFLPITFWVRLFEICDIALLLAWGGFFLLGFGTLIAGQIAVHRVRDTYKLAHRSRWTGLLMLSLPAMAFLIVTISAWSLLTLSLGQAFPPTPYSPLWCSLYSDRCWAGALPCLHEIPAYINHRLSLALQILLFFTGLSLIPATWGLAPVVWKEIFPPKPIPQSPERNSASLGNWLTLAFQGLTVSGVILLAATMIVLPTLFSMAALKPGFLGTELGEHLFDIATISGTGLLGLLLVRGRLRKLVLGFRPVLDILLDVDNWFREHPRDSNPKARICGRWVSLLRYIANWKQDSDDPNSGYDGIVIIAHSQGTVITADFLRYLKIESAGNFTDYDSELGPLKNIPIFFFTMGCPLRQLYGIRFPHLYHWARHDDDIPMDTWNPHDIVGPRSPNPDDLTQVKRWVNCYRSGDYVGRFLWRTDSCCYLWNGDCGGSPVSMPVQYNSTDGTIRLEFCIGAGAHTHYWDRTAGAVGAELDRLIAEI